MRFFLISLSILLSLAVLKETWFSSLESYFICLVLTIVPKTPRGHRMILRTIISVIFGVDLLKFIKFIYYLYILRQDLIKFRRLALNTLCHKSSP